MWFHAMKSQLDTDQSIGYAFEALIPFHLALSATKDVDDQAVTA